MSMSDDTVNPASKTQSLRRESGSPSTASGGAGGLPGLAAFGQMKTYKPTTAGVDETPPDAAVAPDAQDPFDTRSESPANTYSYEQANTPAAPSEPAPSAFDMAEVRAANQAANRAAKAAVQQPYEQDPDASQAYAMPGNGAQETPPAPEAADRPADYAYSPDELQQYMAQLQAEDERVAASEAGAAEASSYPDELSQAELGVGQSAQGGGAEEPFDLGSSTALKTFEARYDQHPEIPLGSFDDPDEQPFFHADGQQDAEFDAGMEPEDMAPPRERSGRRMVMIGSGLVGALALGGALAFAYKTGGNPQLADSGAPPLIKADDRPVKVTPKEPGGKQFPHQNKQIYDRLSGEQQAEVERLVPREEQVATAPAKTAGLDADIPSQQQQVASADARTAADAAASGGPHKVRTLQVRPDGTVVQPQAEPATAQHPAIPALPPPGSDMTTGVAVTIPETPAEPAVPAQPASDPTTVAAISQPEQTAPQQPSAAEPVPVAQEPAEAESAPTAAIAPLPEPKPTVPTRTATAAVPAEADGSIFVVQVAARRSQAMALAAFADLQQKYTKLLGNYQPMIQSADLGNKGTWYRLRVGPMSKKAEADSLCRNLKKAGLRSCLVRPL